MIRRVVEGLNIQIYQKNEYVITSSGRNIMNKEAIFLSTRLSLFNFSTPLLFLSSLPPYPNSKSSFKVILVDVVSDVFPHALLFGR